MMSMFTVQIAYQQVIHRSCYIHTDTHLYAITVYVTLLLPAETYTINHVKTMSLNSRYYMYVSVIGTGVRERVRGRNRKLVTSHYAHHM